MGDLVAEGRDRPSARRPDKADVTTGRPSVERASTIEPAIIQATLLAFSHTGGNFSVGDVATFAGISKQAIYRRWDSKHDLLIHALDEGMRQTLVRLSDPLPDDPIEALHELAMRLFEGNQSFAVRTIIFLQVESLKEKRMRARMLEWRDQMCRPIVAQLERLEAAGRRAAGAISTQAAILVDLLTGAAIEVVITGRNDSERQSTFHQRWDVFERIIK